MKNKITTQVVRRLRDGLCSMKKNRTLSYYEYDRLLEGGRMLCWYSVVHERYGN